MEINRLESFSDGVLAVIITFMVLEFKVPTDATLASLTKLTPLFLSYLLSYLTVAIMWVNHHHLLKAARRADAKVMWANSNLLFWMSLFPFATAYIAAHPGQPLPVAVYGAVATPMGFGFAILRRAIACQYESHEPDLAGIHSRVQWKNYFSALLYVFAVGLAFVNVYISYAIYVFVPLSFFLPERGLERFVESRGK